MNEKYRKIRVKEITRNLCGANHGLTLYQTTNIYIDGITSPDRFLTSVHTNSPSLMVHFSSNNFSNHF